MNINAMAKGKLERQKIIRNLVIDNRIASQEDLAAILEEKGILVAQATLSRDIKELKLSKLHDEAGYYYSLSHPGQSRQNSVSGTYSSESIDSIEISGNIAVIKTRPGHANMVASIIDSNSLKEIAGTIAGDDTIFLVVREGFTGENLIHALGKLFRQLGKKKLN